MARKMNEQEKAIRKNIRNEILQRFGADNYDGLQCYEAIFENPDEIFIYDRALVSVVRELCKRYGIGRTFEYDPEIEGYVCLKTA